MEGERQEHGNSRNRSDARQHADQRPDHRSGEREEQVGGRERDAETEREIAEQLHLPLTRYHSGQTGMVSPSPRMKIAQDITISTTAAASVSSGRNPRAA